MVKNGNLSLKHIEIIVPACRQAGTKTTITKTHYEDRIQTDACREATEDWKLCMRWA